MNVKTKTIDFLALTILVVAIMALGYFEISMCIKYPNFALILGCLGIIIWAFLRFIKILERD